MPKAEWGTKHTCKECDTKYYDLFRKPPTCPACGVVINLKATDTVEPIEDDDEADDAMLDDDDDDDDDATLETGNDDSPEIED